MAAADEGDDVSKRSLFLLGPTGVGKSALGNMLTRNDPNNGQKSWFDSMTGGQRNLFDVKQGVNRTTVYGQFREVVFSVVKNVLVEGIAKKVTQQIHVRVHDTPGLDDTQGDSQKFLDELVVNITKEKPNGLIFVLKERITPSITKTLRGIGHCLKSGLVDPDRIGLFVNMLPSVFEFQSIYNPPIDDVEQQTKVRTELVQDARREVSKNLGLNESEWIRVVIGNTNQLWDGLPTLKSFIAGMPEEPMDVTHMSTFTQLLGRAKRAASDATAAQLEAKKEIEDLERKVGNFKKTIAKYEQMNFGKRVAAAATTVSAIASAMGPKAFAAYTTAQAAMGAGAVQAAASASLFVPGVNLGIAAGVGVAGAVAAAVGAYNEYQAWGIPEALEAAEKRLKEVRNQDITEQIKKVLDKFAEMQAIERSWRLLGAQDKNEEL